MSSIEVQHQFPQLQSALQHYIHLSNLTADEVLEKKGRDLGIRLYMGFRSARWRGSRRGQGGIAWREMRRRAKASQGIRLRPGLQPSPAAPATYVRRQRVKGARGGTRRAQVTVQTSEHQKKVYAELMLRQQGIGVLAASFLWVRRRTSKDRGTYFVRNKTGRVLGYVEKGDGSLRIVGVNDALSMVDERYGIVRTAVEEVTADTMQYVERKMSEAFDLATDRYGLSA